MKTAFRNAAARMGERRLPRTRIPIKLIESAKDLTGSDERSVENAQLAEIIAEVKAAFSSGAPQTSRLLSIVAQGLWNPEFQLAQDPDFVFHYTQAIQQSAAKGPLKSAARALLRSYPESIAATEITQMIQSGASETKRGWLADAFTAGIFDDHDVATQTLARALLEAPSGSPFLPLESAGLKGGLLASGFAEAVFVAACELAQDSPDLEAAKKLKQLYFISDGPNRQVRYTGQQAKNFYAIALLWPWAEENPDIELQRWIKKELIEAFGDPRLDQHRWEGIEDEVRQVLCRWPEQE